MQKTISTKELRENFPEVRREIEKGVKFIIIHRSKPIGELTPLSDITRKAKSSTLDVFINPPKELNMESGKSSVKIIRKERE